MQVRGRRSRIVPLESKSQRADHYIIDGFERHLVARLDLSPIYLSDPLDIQRLDGERIAAADNGVSCRNTSIRQNDVVCSSATDHGLGRQDILFDFSVAIQQDQSRPAALTPSPSPNAGRGERSVSEDQLAPPDTDFVPIVQRPVVDLAAVYPRSVRRIQVVDSKLAVRIELDSRMAAGCEPIVREHNVVG